MKHSTVADFLLERKAFKGAASRLAPLGKFSLNFPSSSLILFVISLVFFSLIEPLF